MPFAVLALAACLLMTRIARDPRGGRLTDPRVIGLGVLIGLGGADPQRGGLARPHLGRRRLVRDRRAAGGAAPADRRRRGRRRCSSSRRGRSATGRLRQPAARPGGDERALLSPASTSSPGTTRRRCPATSPSGRRGSSRCASIGLDPQPVQRPALPRPADLAHRPRRPAVESGGRSRSGRSLSQRHHVPGHQPGLPGRDPVGHVPPRRRAGPGPAGRQRPASRSTPDRLDRATARLDAAGRLARARLGIFGSLLFSVALLPSFAADSAGTAEVFSELAGRMAAAGHPLDASAGPGHHRTSRSGWPRPSGSRPWPSPNEPPPDVLDLATTLRSRDAPADPDRAATTSTGRRTSTRARPQADCFRELDLARSMARAARHRRSARGCPAHSRSSARERRPLYSETDGASTRRDGSLGQPLRACDPIGGDLGARGEEST